MRCVHYVIALLALLLTSFGATADCVKQNTLDVAVLQLVEPTFSWEKLDDQTTITTLGTIKNPTPACLSRVLVELKFHDAQKKLIDVVTDFVYSVPASQELAFRIQASAAQPKAAYATVTARIVSADQRIPTKSKNMDAEEEPSLLVQLIASWGTPLLLLGFLAYFLRKVLGKKSPAVITLALIEQHNKLLEHQVAVLARLAEAAEKS